MEIPTRKKGDRMILALLLSVSAMAAPGDFLADLDLFRQRSLLIRSEKEQLEANSTATLSRLLQFTPTLQAGVGRQRDKIDGPGSQTDTSYSYWRATAAWNFFRGGSDYFSWRGARAAESAQAFQVEGQELKTELSGARVIFRRLYLKDVQGAQAELMKLKTETIRIGRDRYRQGKIPLQDVTKMEVDLSQQENVVRQSEIDLAENEAAYRSFFVDELKTRDWPFVSNQALTIVGRQDISPEQKRLELRALSLHDNWLSSILKHSPSVDLNLSYRDYPLNGPGTRAWSGSIELSVPLWSRYEISAASAQAAASAERAANESAANAREEAMRRDFVLKKISLSQKNLEEARLNLEKSDRLYRDMLRSFQLGRLSTNDLFLEQDRKVRALLLFTQSRLSFHESLMEACGLWGVSARDCIR